MNYDTFLCYETKTGDAFAIDIANFLEKRCGACAFAAARQGDISPGCLGERECRYNAIRNSRYVLLLATNGILGSDEVRNELDVALSSNTDVIIFPKTRLKTDRFQECFPKLRNAQMQPPWQNRAELANEVADWYLNLPSTKMPSQPDRGTITDAHPSDTLIVRPYWSVQCVCSAAPNGKIVFDITNASEQAIQLFGYRMFRVSPDGKKDFYYNGISVDAPGYNIWAYSRIFRLLLLGGDRHVFNWGEVNIPNTYGLNAPGVWTTEIQVAYFQEGMSDLQVAKGTTTLEHKSANHAINSDS